MCAYNWPWFLGCTVVLYVLTNFLWTQKCERKKNERLIKVVVKKKKQFLLYNTNSFEQWSKWLTDRSPQDFDSSCMCALWLMGPIPNVFFLRISGSLSASCILIPNKTSAREVPLLTPSPLISSLMLKCPNMAQRYRGRNENVKRSVQYSLLQFLSYI